MRWFGLHGVLYGKHIWKRLFSWESPSFCPIGIQRNADFGKPWKHTARGHVETSPAPPLPLWALAQTQRGQGIWHLQGFSFPGRCCLPRWHKQKYEMEIRRQELVESSMIRGQKRIFKKETCQTLHRHHPFTIEHWDHWGFNRFQHSSTIRMFPSSGNWHCNEASTWSWWSPISSFALPQCVGVLMGPNLSTRCHGMWHQNKNTSSHFFTHQILCFWCWVVWTIRLTTSLITYSAQFNTKEHDFNVVRYGLMMFNIV